ncbi:DUF3085 domain-containing protein [Micromonospora sp. WMMD980]|uniref:DUF3085 domain-containing protein n=1 Tax=Micromonospora sp. WMMD980 TaxID=3016088 RepID=UPI00241789AB|nr:DUF3085 domain-containing protein [Micromonospora sp. WMMD980]MDG4803636.1 DUF3085 domain-containing protein [Micromonospora sp. WMMD980]
MALHLYFPLPETLRLAEHAVAAAEHVASYTEREDGVACPGALEWVHDDGVYLMSNGLPRLADPQRPGSNLTVYAHGWNPRLDAHRSDPDLGGDDFVEHLHLTAEPDPLIGQLRRAHTVGYQWLDLMVEADTFTHRFTRTPRLA